MVICILTAKLANIYLEMGDSIGDIIYMVLMVAALVVSVIVKAKKAPQEGSPVPQSEVNEDEHDEEFTAFSDWLSGGEEKTKEDTVVSSTPSPQQEKMPYERMRSHLADSYHKTKRKEKFQRSERVPQAPLKSAPRRSVTEEEEDSEASTWFNDTQDLRRAIIYSEILKRPTF